MTETDRLLRAILTELKAIRAALSEPAEKKSSGASVTSIGDVGGDDVPRQVVPGTVRRGDRTHVVERIKGDTR